MNTYRAAIMYVIHVIIIIFEKLILLVWLVRKYKIISSVQIMHITQTSGQDYITTTTD